MILILVQTHHPLQWRWLTTNTIGAYTVRLHKHSGPVHVINLNVWL